MKKSALLILTSLVSFQLFAMEALTDTAMQQVEGQAGADLSLKLVLNQVNTKDSEYLSTDKSYSMSNAYKFDNGTGGACVKLEFCHLAISVNNRYVDSIDANGVANGAASSTEGYKLWVVFKGIQGTINIQKLGLDGTDLTYKDDGGAERIKPAIQLSFDATKPIQIRNFGFDAVSIENDKFKSKTNADGSVTETATASTASSDYGYLKNTTYASDHQSVYDQKRETGFMGMRMNGNLALQGKVMMFSCDASHPRC